MNYEETIHYLYTSAPLFQNIGAGAYKEGLANTKTLDEHFDHPQKNYKTIHIAGTNGKGSCAHTLAAILQAQGYKTGLYTSPHLVDFRERIRVNGKMMPEQYVIDFVENEKSFFEPLHPSFFELTTALAFKYFAEQNIDIAVVEVGLGGRLDCTNIIHPEVSIITNISFDHMQFLGNTLAEIAGEKAGIIKSSVPVVVGETTPETRPVFLNKAKEVNTPIIWAEEENEILSSTEDKKDGGRIYKCKLFDEPLKGELGGDYQMHNANTILCAVKQLRKRGIVVSDAAIREGFAKVSELTGIRGRWEIIFSNPTTIIDTGHNPGGLKYNMAQLVRQKAKTLRIVVGMVSDKDVSGSLKLMPKNAEYYFTKASVKRALDEKELAKIGEALGLHGRSYSTVKEAAKAAKDDAEPDDVIYIGGSNFIIGDFLKD